MARGRFWITRRTSPWLNFSLSFNRYDMYIHIYLYIYICDLRCAEEVDEIVRGK